MASNIERTRLIVTKDKKKLSQKIIIKNEKALLLY